MKHLIPILLIIICKMIPQNLNAQEVVASGGNYYDTGQISISWTLGETMIETFGSTDLILTQGFQQPVLSVSTLIEDPGLDFQITAFPNPTRGHVNISTDLLQADNLIYRVYDMQGRFIISNRLDGTQTRVAFDDYNPGTYFIRIIRDDIPVKIFKIIKQ
ncbi:MAG: T9SS C-terminal target domain-containing protein [Bacteroidetes bacterium]|nr:MAG: T9SS C-terminal target domain-containing protein [Bacteroidota bacterium]